MIDTLKQNFAIFRRNFSISLGTFQLQTFQPLVLSEFRFRNDAKLRVLDVFFEHFNIFAHSENDGRGK